MRRMAMAVVGLVLSVASISAQTTPEAKATAAQYKDGLLKARAESLGGTTVTPHLEEAITPGKNLIWCSTFQLVWNEACALIGTTTHAAALKQLLELFPQQEVPEDYDERMELVHNLYRLHSEHLTRLESSCEEANGMIDHQLAAWINGHSHVFG